MSTQNVETIFPLTAPQQGMLFSTLRSPKSGMYVEQVVFDFTGTVNRTNFQAAWARTVSRHQILRSGFVWQQQGEPLQVVLRQVEIPFEERDWRALTAEQRLASLASYLEDDRRRGFRFTNPPLMRLALFQTGQQECTFVWTHHHILLDGWSLASVFREFLAFYHALCEGRDLRLPDVPAYHGYLTWLNKQDAEAAERFWRDCLSGFERPTPLGREASSGRAFDGDDVYGEARTALPEPLATALRASAARRQCTVSTLVHGAWALLLARYSGDDDVVFGTTVAGRPAELPGIESAVGLYVNTLPIRARVRPDTSLEPWLEQLRDESFTLRLFESTSGARIREWSTVPGALPLYESLLVYENYPADTDVAQLDGLTFRVSRVQILGARTQYALTLLVSSGRHMTLRLIYDRRRFAHLDPRLALDHLSAFLTGMVDGQKHTLADLLGAVAEHQRPSVRPVGALHRQGGLVPGRTPLEEIVADIWTHILGVPVGIHDNFFEAGGHSLLATQVVAMMNEAFGAELPLSCLFESPTVATLAAVIAQQRTSEAERGLTVAALPAIKPDPATKHLPFPLTDIQQAYWIGRQGDFELGNIATHVYTELEGEGLDLERFERAWQRLVARHDMLRAVILPDGRQQILDSVPPYRIETLDVRGLDTTTIADALDRVRQRLSHQVLNPEMWPLFEIRATLLDGGRVRLHLSYDLLVADGRSAHILSQELGLLYHDPDAVLEPIELSFRDYVLAEINLRQTPLYERSLQFWKGRVLELPPAPELPLAASPSSLGKPHFTRRGGRLEPEVWQRLKGRAARLGVTPSTLLLAAFAECLARWSKSLPFTINLTLFNRLPLHAQVNDIIGDFTSLTLLEVNTAELGTFEARVKRLQQQLWQDMEHRYVSGVRVLRELHRVRHGGSHPLMPVVFTSTLSLRSLASAPAGPALPADTVYSVGQTPQVWLDNQVSEHDGRLMFNWDAVDALFPEGLLDDMFEGYRRLLHGLAHEVAEEPRDVLMPPQQAARRTTVNSTKAPVPLGLLHSHFVEQALVRPDSEAVITSERTLTYRELHHRARIVASQLRAGGASPNALVAVVMDKGWEQVVATLGVLMSGAAYLPVDPHLPAERISYLLAHGEVVLALTQPQLDVSLEWPGGIRRLRVEDEPHLDEPVEDWKPVQTQEDLAYVIYTSGSTGQPKGVAIDHRGAANTVADVNRRFGVSSDDRVLALSSLSFDLSVYDIFGTLSAGGTLVIPNARSTREPAHLLDLMRRGRVTIWNSVPALMEMLVEYAEHAGPGGLDSLRLVMLSGDWIPVSLPDRIKALAQGAKVVGMGGATEASIWSIVYPVHQVESSWKSIPYGKPMLNQTVHVLNSHLEPCPDWVPGHLYIGGIGLARGYWRDQEKTDASFLRHPRTGERLYRTGDLGRYLPDGNVEFLGREDLQVKIGGYRIELGEVEAALLQHPGIDAAVVSAAGEMRGHKRLLAHIVPNKAAVNVFEAEDVSDGDAVTPGTPGVRRLDEQHLRSFLRGKLPEYMIPAAFIPLRALPLTANGKVDRNKLPVPDAGRSEPNLVAPLDNPIEEMLARLWSELLGVERFSPRDDFFEQGGDSILATKLASLVRNTFKITLPLEVIFYHPTLAGLAARIEAARAAAEGLQTQPIVPALRDGNIPLSFMQRRLWFVQQMNPVETGYNVAGAIALTNVLDAKALKMAVSEIVRRHEVLRTHFDVVDGEPQQVIDPAVPLEIPLKDLTDLPEGQRAAEAAAIAAAEVRKPFDLSRGPLVRLLLLRLRDDSHVLFFNMHHAISDAWSMAILARELNELYSAFARGRPSPLSELPIQYADFAIWQRRRFQGGVLDAHLRYWKRQIAGAEPARLPLDHPRPERYVYHSAAQSITLPPDLGDALQRLAVRQGVTRFMASLAAFKVLLHHYSGQQDIVVATSVAGRNSVEVEPLIGLFVNVLLLRSNVGGDPAFSEFLARVRDVSLAAYAHQELPFEVLVKELHPARSLKDPVPLFNVLFMLDGISVPALTLAGLEIARFEIDRNIARYDLNLHVTKCDDDLRVDLHYNTSLFEPHTATRILRDYSLVLREVCQRPEARLGEISALLADDDKQQRSERLKRRKKLGLEALQKSMRETAH